MLLPHKFLLLLLGLQLHLLFLHFHLASHHLFLLKSGLLSALQLLLFCLLLLPLLLSLAPFFFCAFLLCPLLHLSVLCLTLCLGRRLRCSCLRAAIVFLLLCWLLLLLLIAFTTCSHKLGHIRRRINTRCRCPEHLLQPKIRLISLLTRQHHARLDVHLLLHDHFGE